MPIPIHLINSNLFAVKVNINRLSIGKWRKQCRNDVAAARGKCAESNGKDTLNKYIDKSMRDYQYQVRGNSDRFVRFNCEQ